MTATAGPGQQQNRQSRVCNRASNKGYPNVPEDFTIMEKAPMGGPSPG